MESYALLIAATLNAGTVLAIATSAGHDLDSKARATAGPKPSSPWKVLPKPITRIIFRYPNVDACRCSRNVRCIPGRDRWSG